MSSSDPQFIYMVLILPSLFGLTLVGEGVHKLMDYRASGWVNIIMGVMFMSVVIIAYFLLSGTF